VIAKGLRYRIPQPKILRFDGRTRRHEGVENILGVSDTLAVS
jgi:hypothetical protein